MRINANYEKLKESYLFSRIAKKVAAYGAAHPERRIIRMGIGDVTRPLVPTVIEAMERAVREMGEAATFRGYGEEQGYAFLREAVCGYYAGKAVTLRPDEVFISDGAKSDLGNILDLFGEGNTALIADPVYPVYVDTNIMAGREIRYMRGTPENGFLPMPDGGAADIIYLCSPNNPTGAVYSRAQLTRWVEYALERDAVILFDAAYEIFVRDPGLPTSIYEIPGAQRCAIEFGSFSKTAGFTGTRCGYTVVPHELVREGMALNRMWLRRQSTKFNGVPYIVQRGAEAVFTPAGMAEVLGNIAYYLENARLIASGLQELNIWHMGGENAPYIWMRCPRGMDSWTLFDHLLEDAGVVGTPGVGFGEMGEGFFRLSAFGNQEDTQEAMERLGGALRA